MIISILVVSTHAHKSGVDSANCVKPADLDSIVKVRNSTSHTWDLSQVTGTLEMGTVCEQYTHYF